MGLKKRQRKPKTKKPANDNDSSEPNVCPKIGEERCCRSVIALAVSGNRLYVLGKTDDVIQQPQSWQLLQQQQLEYERIRQQQQQQQYRGWRKPADNNIDGGRPAAKPPTVSLDILDTTTFRRLYIDRSICWSQPVDMVAVACPPRARGSGAVDRIYVVDPPSNRLFRVTVTDESCDGGRGGQYSTTHSRHPTDRYPVGVSPLDNRRVLVTCRDDRTLTMFEDAPQRRNGFGGGFGEVYRIRLADGIEPLHAVLLPSVWCMSQQVSMYGGLWRHRALPSTAYDVGRRGSLFAVTAAGVDEISATLQIVDMYGRVVGYPPALLSSMPAGCDGCQQDLFPPSFHPYPYRLTLDGRGRLNAFDADARTLCRLSCVCSDRLYRVSARLLLLGPQTPTAVAFYERKGHAYAFVGDETGYVRRFYVSRPGAEQREPAATVGGSSGRARGKKAIPIERPAVDEPPRREAAKLSKAGIIVTRADANIAVDRSTRPSVVDAASGVAVDRQRPESICGEGEQQPGENAGDTSTTGSVSTSSDPKKSSEADQHTGDNAGIASTADAVSSDHKVNDESEQQPGDNAADTSISGTASSDPKKNGEAEQHPGDNTDINSTAVAADVSSDPKLNGESEQQPGNTDDKSMIICTACGHTLNVEKYRRPDDASEIGGTSSGDITVDIESEQRTGDAGDIDGAAPAVDHITLNSEIVQRPGEQSGDESTTGNPTMIIETEQHPGVTGGTGDMICARSDCRTPDRDKECKSSEIDGTPGNNFDQNLGATGETTSDKIMGDDATGETTPYDGNNSSSSCSSCCRTGSQRSAVSDRKQTPVRLYTASPKSAERSLRGF